MLETMIKFNLKGKTSLSLKSLSYIATLKIKELHYLIKRFYINIKISSESGN